MPTLTGLALSRASVDRAAHRRSEPDVVAHLLADVTTRVLALHTGASPAAGPVSPVRDHALLLRPPSAADDAATAIFLGEDADGPVLAVLDGGPAPEAAGGLRELGSELSDRDAGLLTVAVALANWHATHTRCPRCGEPTEVVLAGWARRCVADGSEHYPRTDPAVIMAVLDSEDRLLLGHQATWPDGRFSVLAGFVEPGESFEQTVRREVMEEVGVVIGEVTYRGSQPWPFPASLMIGCRAEALSTSITVDGVEITQARWFGREDLREAVASRDVLLPPTVSIARRLVEEWYGKPLAAPSAWR